MHFYAPLTTPILAKPNPKPRGKQQTPDLRSGGCVTLTDIYNKQDSDNGPLWVLDSDDNKVDGGGEPAEPTGYWLLTSSLIVLDNAKLVVKGTDIDGDCDVLRVQVCIFRCCLAEVVDCLGLLNESNGAKG